MSGVSLLFPGQGAQYCGMGKDFYESFAVARETFDEADDILQYKLSDIVFNGPESLLKETKYSQVGIYVTSMAVLRVINDQLTDVVPTVCSGLSLGEYTAITAAGRMEYCDGLALVSARGQFMHDACDKYAGTMAAIIGLDADTVEDIVLDIDDVWTANYNCPKQVVISGTLRAVKNAIEVLKRRGAKTIPLNVHGAFHSELMAEAQHRLVEKVRDTKMKDKTVVDVVMNTTGMYAGVTGEMKENLVKQVTSPVRWEQGIRTITNSGISLFVEIGCGKTLKNLNRRIGVVEPTITVEVLPDLEKLSDAIKEIS